MTEPDLDGVDSEELPDLSAARLIDLLEPADPALTAALASLTRHLRSDSTLTTGWNSFIGPG